MNFILYFNILFLYVATSSGDKFIEKLSSIEWRCADENCSVPISVARAKQSYSADHKVKVSFRGNDIINILGKPTDNKEKIWLVSVGDKFGVTSEALLREQDILIPLLNCTTTKFDISKFKIYGNRESGGSKNANIKPSPAVEVVDGTTINTIDQDITVTTEDSSEIESFDVSTETKTDYKSDNDESSKVAHSENAFGSNLSESSPPLVGIPPENNSDGKSAPEDYGSKAVDSSILESANETFVNSDPKNPQPDQPENNLSDKQMASTSKTNSVKSSEAQGDPLVGNEKNDSGNSSPTVDNSEPSLKNDTVPEVPKAIVEEEQKDASLQLQNGSEVQNDSTLTLENEVESPSKNDSASSSKNDAEPSSKNDSEPLPENDAVSSSKNDAEPSSKNDTKPSPENDAVSSSENYNDSSSQNDVTSTNENSEALNDTAPNTESPKLPGLLDGTLPKTESDTQPTFQSDSSQPGFEIGNVPLKVALTPENSNLPMSSPEPLPNDHVVESQVALPHSEVPETSQKEFNPSFAEVGQQVDNQDLNNTEKTPNDSARTSIDYNVPQPDPSNQVSMPSTNEENMPASEPSTITPEVLPRPSLPLFSNIPSKSVDPLNFVSPEKISTKSTEQTPPVNEPLETSTEKSTAFSASTPSEEDKQAVPEEPEKIPASENSLVQENVSSKESEILDSQPENETPNLTTELPLMGTLEQDNILEESTNWFSPVSSVMNSILDMFVKSDIGIDDTKTVEELTTEKTFDAHSFDYDKQSSVAEAQNVCEKDDYCDQAEEKNEDKNNQFNDFISHSIPGFKENNVSPSTLVCLIVTSIAILLFSLGYYYLENIKHESELAARINSLSAELFFAQKELSTAEENLTKSNDDFQRLISNTSSNEEAMIQVKQELEENKDVKQKLEQEIKRLEKEIESLVESSNEMHRMLAESISEDERVQALLANIDDLKSVVSSKLEEISSLTNQLDKEKQEVELLTIALKKSEEKKEVLEEKLEKIVQEIDSKAMAVTKEFEEKIISLERMIEENSLERVNFEKEIYELKQQCESLSVEKELAEKSLKKAQGLAPGKALADWLETKDVRVQLGATQKEVEKLKTELVETKEHISSLQGREKELLSEIETLNNNYETAEKNKIEALTKLQVLSNYFKEKETQLQEELGEKEAQWLQKQSEDHTIYEQMRSLREENLSYKAQNEALKREILDQEASFKIQIANEEQKTQEHWLQLRHTERRLKETQMEASHLRSRLTAHETNPDSMEDKHNKSVEMVNGEAAGLSAASPPFMLYPSPDFIPPPPLISPSRPPPLGRLSSPPLTPPPPLSVFDMFPPPPSSPPPPLRIHKPQLREPPHKQKDSHSSTHSSESTEKPIRRGKR